jgi:hypothetical protein
MKARTQAHGSYHVHSGHVWLRTVATLPHFTAKTQKKAAWTDPKVVQTALFETGYPSRY